MAHQGHTCGAITGSLMAIGLARGRKFKTESREPANDPGAELQRRFVAHLGALTCNELTGLDITSPDWSAAYAAAGGNQRCGGYLEFAARTVVELIGE